MNPLGMSKMLGGVGLGVDFEAQCVSTVHGILQCPTLLGMGLVGCMLDCSITLQCPHKIVGVFTCILFWRGNGIF